MDTFWFHLIPGKETFVPTAICDDCWLLPALGFATTAGGEDGKVKRFISTAQTTTEVIMSAKLAATSSFFIIASQKEAKETLRSVKWLILDFKCHCQ